MTVGPVQGEYRPGGQLNAEPPGTPDVVALTDIRSSDVTQAALNAFAQAAAASASINDQGSNSGDEIPMPPLDLLPIPGTPTIEPPNEPGLTVVAVPLDAEDAGGTS